MPDGLNKVMLIGNLGTDPEMRYTANGSAVTTFRLAVSRSFGAGEEGRREETEWFSVVAWNKLAELLGQHMQKGRKVYVEGRLATRSWDDKDTGQKRYRTEVIANQVLFLDRVQGAGGFPDSGGMGMGGDIDPDDLPFEN
jgi:single-strand DNA-binding protein